MKALEALNNRIKEPRGQRLEANPNIVIRSPVGGSTQVPKPNAPCICGSGKKSKRCCLRQWEARRAAELEQARSIGIVYSGKDRVLLEAALQHVTAVPCICREKYVCYRCKQVRIIKEAIAGATHDTDLRKEELPEMRGSQSEA